MSDTQTGVDLDAIRADYLRQCGPCDYGLVEYGCNCPTRDPRWAISVLADEVERLRAPKPLSRHRLTLGRLSLYLEPRDAWVGLFVAPAAFYVCLLPFVVVRWRR